MQNTILSFTDMNSRKRVSAYLFADLRETEMNSPFALPKILGPNCPGTHIDTKTIAETVLAYRTPKAS